MICGAVELRVAWLLRHLLGCVFGWEQGVRILWLIVFLTIATAKIAVAGGSTGSAPSNANISDAPRVEFAPHRAVYDLSLAEARSGSSVVNVRGRIVYELTGSLCDGYAQKMRFVTLTTNDRGETQSSDLRTSSWEDVAAQHFRFESSTLQDERESGRTQGLAERGAGQKAVVVRLKEPVVRSVELPGDVYFPIQHAMAVVEAARSGKTILAADLFDGAESGADVYATSTVIGRVYRGSKLPSVSLPKRERTKLMSSPARPISISYFAKARARADALPVYEMFYKFHDNGITSSLVIDQGDVVISGQLKQLTFLKKRACGL